MIAALEGGEWSAARPGRTPGKDPVPILQEARVLGRYVKTRKEYQMLQSDYPDIWGSRIMSTKLHDVTSKSLKVVSRNVLIIFTSTNK